MSNKCPDCGKMATLIFGDEHVIADNEELMTAAWTARRAVTVAVMAAHDASVYVGE